MTQQHGITLWVVLSHFFLIKGTKKRPRLEKGQDMDMHIININMKKEDDVKLESKGIKLYIYFFYLIFAN